MNRSAYHQQHAARAEAEARRLLAERASLGARWLDWVAAELYRLTPPEYSAMVRRELQRLNSQ